MIAVLLWSLGAVVFVVEMAVISLAWSDGDAIRANEVRLIAPLAEAREDLEPEPWPVRQTPTDLAAAYVDEPPYPWRSLPLEPGLLDRVHTYAERGVYPRAEPLTIGERARRGPITEQFWAIVDGVELHQLGAGSHRERRAAA